MPQRLRVPSQSDEGAKSMRRSGKSRGEVAASDGIDFFARPGSDSSLQANKSTRACNHEPVKHKHWCGSQSIYCLRTAPVLALGCCARWAIAPAFKTDSYKSPWQNSYRAQGHFA